MEDIEKEILEAVKEEKLENLEKGLKKIEKNGVKQQLDFLKKINMSYLEKFKLYMLSCNIQMSGTLKSSIIPESIRFLFEEEGKKLLNVLEQDSKMQYMIAHYIKIIHSFDFWGAEKEKVFELPAVKEVILNYVTNFN